MNSTKYRTFTDLLKKLSKRLEWDNHQLFSIPGPNYERIVFESTGGPTSEIREARILKNRIDFRKINKL